MKQKEISTIRIARASLNTLCPELVRHLAVADVFVYVTQLLALRHYHMLEDDYFITMTKNNPDENIFS